LRKGRGQNNDRTVVGGYGKVGEVKEL